MFEFTADDVARGIVVEEKTSLLCEVTAYEEQPSKDQKSINHVVDMKCVNAENPEYVGISLRAYFSEKAPSMALPFLRAVGYQPPREGGKLDLNVFVQRKSQLFVDVKPGSYNNNPVNEIIGYRSVD